MNHLKGARVLVTRPAHQAKKLCRLLAECGGAPIRLPTLEIVATNDCRPIRAVLTPPGRFQWLVFISVNAVNFALKANSGKIEMFEPTRIAAIGRATAQALEMAGLPVDLKPLDGFDSEALLLQLPLQQGQRCLIVRGEGGREELADGLRKQGADVEYLEVYKRIMPNIDTAPVISLLTDKRLDCITMTSGQALQNLMTMLGEGHHQALFAIPLAVVSDRIKSMAEHMGFKRIAVADNPSDTAILETVTTLINGE